MSRQLRIEIENGIYHVTARGCERRVIVRDDRDREKWSTLLDRLVVRLGWRFFAWVLMDDHFHLSSFRHSRPTFRPACTT